MSGQRPELEWRDASVPVSVRFDDPYFSLENGLAETQHVFLAGNDLPERFAPGFQIAELGFGTGLNLATVLDAWRAAGIAGPLHFTSFEAFPMSGPDMVRALSAFPELEATTRDLFPHLGAMAFELPDLVFRLVVGDARETVPAWDGLADAWFLDGFAPARNPELWEEGLLRDVARHTAPGGTAATYTAAGFVRRGLASAGFEVERAPGFGRKRHMTTARKPA
ncbi:tRNA U34 5-methylaminomethyl-2-thiouridine-forming methyltransferase MnmC [Poseidonocella pacifica]|uniref:tRNA U34 5-methylaminomethyl-2-thiouridine-forming methyltransferase MnmC n=1 Tax=Poseidonocella pacifica TaxID=871651 RepID=A0A1I0Y579_9RHOB|nr:tRNA (5-methylaminomethyl-2-thiouridine)(34)-methyltransferase MnmD [Poseidonocella pacifica]SFB08324.1 tRNA U34 5-methylaminomethyl-2-thiouridine-forming methyltransferase MnmC [Poseidonocella pacifica]